MAKGRNRAVKEITVMMGEAVGFLSPIVPEVIWGLYELNLQDSTFFISSKGRVGCLRNFREHTLWAR